MESVDAKKDTEAGRTELLSLRSEVKRLERELWEQRVRRADLTARLKERDRWIDSVRRSHAWKLLKPLWKLQHHFSKRRLYTISRETRGELVSNVDTFDATPSKELKVTGWCYSHGGPEVVGVRAKVGAKSYFARYGLTRHEMGPEVLDYPAAVHTGFSVIIPAAAAGLNFSLEAITQAGPWRCFFTNSQRVSGRVRHLGDALTTCRHERNQEQTVTIYSFIDTDSWRTSPSHEEIVRVLRSASAKHQRHTISKAPFLSVVTPLFYPNPRWIVETAASLLEQSFTDWEWCLLTPPSPVGAVQDLLDQIATVDGRFQFLPQGSDNPSKALNSALEFASGEALCFLDLGDSLHREALSAIREKIIEGDSIIYSDEDGFDEGTGERREPFFKPDWSPEFLRGTIYLRHGLTVRRELAAQVRFNPEYDGMGQFDFMLRATETGARVGHIPRVLYHSRKLVKPMSLAPENADQTRALLLLQERAVNEQLHRLSLPARAEMTLLPGRLKMVPAPRATYPMISIIIPTKDSPEFLSRCLESIYRNTHYPNFETIIMDNGTSNRDALTIMRKYPAARVDLPGQFNFSRANNLGAKHATGEYIVFLNNDTEVVSTRWLDHLLYYAEQPDIGTAGALLLHDDGTVQHAGVILGMNGTGDHAMRGFSARSDGYAGSLSCAREVSAVTAACMMMPKPLFEEIGGFDENFSTMYQDLDLCLRLRKLGLRIIWTPQALLIHHESMSRSKYYDAGDRKLLLDRWQKIIARGDPYYNQNLDLEHGDYGRNYRS